MYFMYMLRKLSNNEGDKDTSGNRLTPSEVLVL